MVDPFSRCSATRKGLVVAALFASAAPARGSLSEVVSITTEGRAPGMNSNAMEQAKQDALRRAVEQACGTFINAQTRTKDHAAVYDKVMSQAAGYVLSFDIVERRFENGATICKVAAKVSTKSFELDWARFAHTLEAEGNPRCVVLVVDDNDMDDNNPPKVNGVAQSVLENFFMSKGVQLMDQTGSKDIKDRDIELAAKNNDIDKLAAMGAALKADVVIAGRAEARHAGVSELAGQTLFKWTATLSVRAYQTDSAQLLMSNTYSGTAASANQSAGGDEAIRKCAESHAGTILRDIGEAWRKRQNVRRTLQITLEKCSREDFKAFEIDGVRNVRLRELVNNVCQVEIDWAYDLERLVSRIEALRVGTTTFALTEQTHDRATFKVVK
jgi:hypothetical protein